MPSWDKMATNASASLTFTLELPDELLLADVALEAEREEDEQHHHDHDGPAVALKELGSLRAVPIKGA